MPLPKMRAPKKWTPAWFRWVRFALKWTLVEAGAAAGVSRVSWHRWENGVYSPRAEQRDKLEKSIAGKRNN